MEVISMQDCSNIRRIKLSMQNIKQAKMKLGQQLYFTQPRETGTNLSIFIYVISNRFRLQQNWRSGMPIPFKSHAEMPYLTKTMFVLFNLAQNKIGGAGACHLSKPKWKNLKRLFVSISFISQVKIPSMSLVYPCSYVRTGSTFNKYF